MQRLRHRRDLEHPVVKAIVRGAGALVVAGLECARELGADRAQFGDVARSGPLDRAAHQLGLEQHAQGQRLARRLDVERRDRPRRDS